MVISKSVAGPSHSKTLVQGRMRVTQSAVRLQGQEGELVIGKVQEGFMEQVDNSNDSLAFM